VTSVAFHVDQPFARVPGDIGAYVRGPVPALAAAEPGWERTAGDTPSEYREAA
jgi:hypothetical protein